MPAATNRRLQMLVGVVVCATILVAGCGDDNSEPDPDDGSQSVTTDSLGTATELADAWIQGWNDNDADAIAAVFAADGSYVDPYSSATISKAQMPEWAQPRLDSISNLTRLSDLELTSAETYTWESEHDHESVAQGWVRERAVIEIELSGDQVLRIEILEYEVIEVLE